MTGLFTPVRSTLAAIARPLAGGRRRAKPTGGEPMWVISVFGKFGDRVLVEMGASEARDLFGDEALSSAQPAYMIDAAERDIAGIRERDAGLADSALAALVVTLAYELANPFNSATAKSNCAGQLRDALRDLRELVPPEEEQDGVDELSGRREERERERAGASAPEDLSRSRDGG